MPCRTAEPIVAAASIVVALQAIGSRNMDPLQWAVVTVGAIHAGRADNVIAHSAVLELSVRASDDAVRRRLQQRIRDLASVQAEGFGAQAQLDWPPGYAVLFSTPRETDFARQIALELLGP